ncbi:hypothetical protein OIO90_005096 [Microbotryomycetes sp. JL221]|nr:hypothetical protein OIO90_005096 [Microbotryomycetes sp. JL221]
MDNPWGYPDADEPSSSLVVPTSFSAPLPSTSTSTLAVGGNGWSDEPGWGVASDNDSMTFSRSSLTGSPIGVARNEDGDDFRLPTLDTGSIATAVRSDTISGDHDHGWTSPDDTPGLPRPISPPRFDEPEEVNHHGIPHESPLDDEHTSATAVSDDAVSEAESNGGWAPVGSPILPPIASLKVDEQDPTRSSKGASEASWRPDEQEWQPPDVPEPLPSFGDAFDKARRRPSVASGGSEDGWGGNKYAPYQGTTMGEEEEEATPEERAMDEDGRQTPRAEAFDSYYANEDEARSADAAPEDQKETERQNDFQPIPEGKSEPNKSDARPIRSWWRRGGSNVAQNSTQPSSVKAEPQSPASVEQAQNTASPPQADQTGAPSTFGRLLGRFKRQAASSDGGSADGSSAKNIADEASVVPLEWEPKDLDALGVATASGSHASRMDQARSSAHARSHANDDNDDGEVELFDTRRPTAQRRRSLRINPVPAFEPEDDFGGLIGAFSQAPPKASTVPKRKMSSTKTLDPFDPFADIDDDGPQPGSMANTLPSRNPVRAARHATDTRRPLTPPDRVRPSGATSPAVASFPASFAAPQARAMSSVVATSGDPDDSFDAFFNSVAASTQSHQAPLASKPASLGPAFNTRPVVSTSKGPASPLRLSSSNKSPLHALPRMSPPPKSTSPITPLAPPPPPAQPVNRISPIPRIDSPTGKSMAASSSASNGSKPATTLPPELLAAMSRPLVASKPSLTAASTLPASRNAQTPQPQQSQQQALSKDDFAFFES